MRDAEGGGRGGRGAPPTEEGEEPGADPQTGVVKSFESMRLKDELLRGVYSYGFERPSAIQQRAVVPIVRGRDVIAQAQSGTGKSSMIALAVCQICDTGPRAARGVQALVLSPTRELAAQHEKVILAIGEFMNIQCHCCIGGTSVGADLRRLEAGGVHCVSGTPGRVFDMIRRRALETRGVRTMVLDEADEMLSLGFKEQIYDIYRCAARRPSRPLWPSRPRPALTRRARAGTCRRRCRWCS